MPVISTAINADAIFGARCIHALLGKGRSHLGRPRYLLALNMGKDDIKGFNTVIDNMILRVAVDGQESSEGTVSERASK